MSIKSSLEIKSKLNSSKNLKHTFLINTLKLLLLNKNFLFFFFYTNISKSKEYQFQLFLQNENLKFLKIKKNLLINKIKNKNFKFFNNLLKNNVMVIFSKNNSNFNYETLQNLIKTFTNNIHFLGMWEKKKFLRPYEVEMSYSLNPFFLNKHLIFSIYLLTKNIKKFLILKKF